MEAKKKTAAKVETKKEVKKAEAKVVETAAAAKAEVQKVADTVKAEAQKATAAVKEETAKAAAAVKEEAQKTPAAKTVRKTAAKAAKKTVKAVTETVYLQYLGKEINKDDVVAQVKELWAVDHKDEAVEAINIYLKPEDNKAYFVVNQKFSGEINL